MIKTMVINSSTYFSLQDGNKLPLSAGTKLYVIEKAHNDLWNVLYIGRTKSGNNVYIEFLIHSSFSDLGFDSLPEHDVETQTGRNLMPYLFRRAIRV
jgi:hypothetical protein